MIIIGNMTRYDTTLAASTDTGSDSTRSTGWVENTVGDHSVYHDNHHPITDHDNHDHQYNDRGCIRTGPGYGGQESEALYQELEPHYQSLDQVIDCFVFFFCKIVKMMIVIDYYSGTNLGGDASQWKDGRCHLGQLIMMNMSCHLFHNFDQMMIFMFIIHPQIWRCDNQRLVESSQWSSLGWEVCKQVESPFISMTIMIMILRCWWIQNWSALPRWHDNGNQDHDK